MSNSSANISGRLRNRLLYLLMVPLILVSSIFIVETYKQSNIIAKESFDKSLEILSVVIMEQSESLSGETITESVINSTTQAIGVTFFYHVSTPQNSLIAGYTHRPKPDKKTYNMPIGRPHLFDATYREKPARAAFFRRHVNNEAYKGWIELTVWQHLDKQYELQTRLFSRSVFRLAALVILVGLILWFGINFGLKPLTHLQRSISRRSINDLKPIKTPIPYEIKQLVESMNDLFYRLESSIEKHESFLANASHQLKTPLANIRGKAELALESSELNLKQVYITDLVKMTDQTSRLVSQMLSLLQAQSDVSLTSLHENIELNQLVKNTCEYYAPSVIKMQRELVFSPCAPLNISVRSPIMITECLSNLIENALNYSHEHGEINVSVNQDEKVAIISITDSGPGIPKEQQQQVTRRFYRIPGTPSSGYGLGLAIVSEILKRLEGKLFFDEPTDKYFAVHMQIPISQKK